MNQNHCAGLLCKQQFPSSTRIHRARPGGFTLVELLVVLSIITILAAISLPAINAARESSRSTTCQSNLRQLGVGLHGHASRHSSFCSGAWDWAEDGAVTEKGWVADLTAVGIPVGKMLCPTNPSQLSEIYRQLATDDAASMGNCIDHLGTPASTAPDGGLVSNPCRRILESNMAPNSAARAQVIQSMVYDKHYNTNFTASWFLVRGGVALDASGNPQPQIPGCSTSVRSRNVTFGPLSLSRLDALGSTFVPLLGDGATVGVVSLKPKGVVSDGVVKSYTNGPVLVDTLSQPQFPSGTPREGASGWWGVWNRSTLQDYRGFAVVHRRSCNILFADGSIRSFYDANGDGLINNGFPSGGGFVDARPEAPLSELFSLYALDATAP